MRGNMEIKKAEMSQLDEIMAIYERARHFMADHGNPTQWTSSYPPKDMIVGDIERGLMYVCLAGQKVEAVFYYREGEEEDYARIYEGAWLDDKPYGVVHRIASAGTVKGAGSFCLAWAYDQCKNVRIDTHRNNVVMQNLLKKNGFEYCGIIYIRNGEERLAYQKNTN